MAFMRNITGKAFTHKYGCAYCGDCKIQKVVKLKEDGKKQEKKNMFCPHYDCPYKEEFEGYKTYEEWYLDHTNMGGYLTLN